jgi:POT family proton-dependent oligopeptide transporter
MDASRGFFGQPAGLSTLFFAELWERFSYYGMRALLLLFLVGAVQDGGFGLDDPTAAAIYGLYTAGVYVFSLPGGWVADRLIGARHAVLWGGAVIAAGHVVLALSTSLATFCAGLGVIVLGTGLLKPNIAALVAALYPEGGARRDAGFTVFYLGINLGAVLGPLVTAWLAQQYGWHVGFLAAAVGMGCGLLWFLATQARLGGAGVAPVARTVEAAMGRQRDLRVLWLGGFAIAALVVGAIASGADAQTLRGAAIYVILGAAVLYFGNLLVFGGLDPQQRRRMLVLLALLLASSVFWSGFEQAGSSMNLFAERHTDRLLGSFEIPAGWFQSLNAAFIIVFAPLFSWLWLALARHGADLSAPAKFVIGLLGMGLGFVVMAAAARLVAEGGLAAPTWLITAYLLHTWGELALSPVGMSATTQLVPGQHAGQGMGLWYASLSMGNLVASLLAGEFDTSRLDLFPSQFMHIFWISAVAAACLLAALPLLRRWSGDRRG